VNDFNRSGRVFQVQLQSEARYRARPENIRDVYLRSRSGDLVPLSAVASVTEVTGPEAVSRFNAFPSAFLIGSPSPGHSSGDALKIMEELAKKNLPPGYALAWSASYLQEKLSGGAATGMFFLGVLMVFLILAAQYERWTLPLAVMLTVPFGVFGALLAVWARGLQNDIYFQIGLITLVGLCAKNAILIVEFAMLKHAEGKSLDEAATEAAKLRFRPIVMTSAAFIFGVLPLAVSSGAGSASRHSIGTGVIGGMIAATFIATLFTPMFFKFVASFRAQKTAAAAQSLQHRSEDLGNE
jgi:HAE1 family hydrophobic/amphiphilic exporter-1/multidrug efflux pump